MSLANAEASDETPESLILLSLKLRCRDDKLVS